MADARRGCPATTNDVLQNPTSSNIIPIVVVWMHAYFPSPTACRSYPVYLNACKTISPLLPPAFEMVGATAALRAHRYKLSNLGFCSAVIGKGRRSRRVVCAGYLREEVNRGQQAKTAAKAKDVRGWTGVMAGRKSATLLYGLRGKNKDTHRFPTSSCSLVCIARGSCVRSTGDAGKPSPLTRSVSEELWEKT